MLNRILSAKEGTGDKMSEKTLTGVVLECLREVFTRQRQTHVDKERAKGFTDQWRM